MAKKNSGLGKGLGAIITSSATPAETVEKEIVSVSKDSIIELELDNISPNPDQPRLHFEESEIEHLAESIDSVGLIQPIIVRKVKNEYYIVAGERRYRAVKSLGKDKIRAIVIKADEEQNLTMALIENVQRQNLDPIEEAKAYKLLINRFKLKQAEVARNVGKERATIANSLRLLNLPESIQSAVSEGTISQGHAKILCSLKGNEQSHYFAEVIDKGLSVRGLEKTINENKTDSDISESKPKGKKEPHIKKMEDKLVSLLGTKVEIKHSGNKGRIEISYYSLEDFDRILEKFEE